MSNSTYKPQLQILALIYIFVGLLHTCSGYIGTAAQYTPPYLPTACYGNDASDFPSSNLFASAGEGIWDMGAACGRQYLVRCISAVVPMTCIAGQTVLVRIVDRAQTSMSRPSRNGTILVLSATAFRAIANSSAAWVCIEFGQA